LTAPAEFLRISSRAVQAFLIEELAAGFDGCGFSDPEKQTKPSEGEAARSAGL
jgi:hypothetical protein